MRLWTIGSQMRTHTYEEKATFCYIQRKECSNSVEYQSSYIADYVGLFENSSQLLYKEEKF